MLGRGVEETRWRTIAADIDGVVQPGEIGKVRLERQAYFAWKAEAEAWAAGQQADGMETTIGSAAISYFGPTDSLSNCWFVRAEKEADS